jgi:hypothetical protein
MKTLITILLVSLASLCHAEDWPIYWIAAKGQPQTKLTLKPKSLDEHLNTLPSGHSEADQDIKSGHVPFSSSIRFLGIFKDRKLFTLEHNVLDSYYTTYHIILAEIEPNKYAPIYVHQYNPGHEKPIALTFVGHNSNFQIRSTIQTVGQGVGDTKNHYSIISNLSDPPTLEHTTTH